MGVDTGSSYWNNNCSLSVLVASGKHPIFSGKQDGNRGKRRVESGNGICEVKICFFYDKNKVRYVFLGVRNQNGFPGWVKVNTDGRTVKALSERKFGEYVQFQYINKAIKSQDLSEYQQICIPNGQVTDFCQKLDMAVKNPKILVATSLYED